MSAAFFRTAKSVEIFHADRIVPADLEFHLEPFLHQFIRLLPAVIFPHSKGYVLRPKVASPVRVTACLPEMPSVKGIALFREKGSVRTGDDRHQASLKDRNPIQCVRNDILSQQALAKQIQAQEFGLQIQAGKNVQIPAALSQSIASAVFMVRQ